MFRYKLHDRDGGDLGEASYAQMIYPGEEIIAGPGEHYHVVDLVEFDLRIHARTYFSTKGGGLRQCSGMTRASVLREALSQAQVRDAWRVG